MIKKITAMILVGFVICSITTGCSRTNAAQEVNLGERTDAAQEVNLGERTDAAQKVTLGEVSGSNYHNSYLGLTFTFPNDWKKLSSREDLESLTKIFNGIDLEEEIRLEEQSLLWLFSISKHEQGPNPSIRVEALKIGSVDRTYGGKITTVEKFVEDLTIELADADDGFSYSYRISDIKNVKLGSKEALFFTATSPGGLERNYLYACEANGYILLFSCHDFSDDKANDEIESFIQTISFS